MIITSEHIRGLLKQTWPDLSQIWLTDPHYEVMPFEWLEKAIKECSLKDLVFRRDVWDCDNYSLQLHARVQIYQYKLVLAGKSKSKHSWAVGECIGFNEGFLGTGIHSQNLAITDKGIVLIEPQEGIIKDPDKSYVPFFVKF